MSPCKHRLETTLAHLRKSRSHGTARAFLTIDLLGIGVSRDFSSFARRPLCAMLRRLGAVQDLKLDTNTPTSSRFRPQFCTRVRDLSIGFRMMKPCRSVVPCNAVRRLVHVGAHSQPCGAPALVLAGQLAVPGQKTTQGSTTGHRMIVEVGRSHRP